ncbi:chromosome condensation protein CrcB [Halobacteriales archaeon QS_4_70_19]|nr:MAG: chromosome condensation protein CrcB [Halobacteriales archaeon QS_4_70_19]
MREWLRRLEPLALVAAGGFVGAALRFAVAEALPAQALPWGTLAANVAGAFLLSLLLYENRLVGSLSAETRLVVGTGFCSSFTTYSTFAVETAGLAGLPALGTAAGATPLLAVVNVALTYVLGFVAIGLGQVVARVMA